jgi:hypothetical protein
MARLLATRLIDLRRQQHKKNILRNGYTDSDRGVLSIPVNRR